MGSLDFFPLRVDEHEESGSLVLSLTLPGLAPEQDVDVTVADGALEVCVERFEETTADEDGVARTEQHFGSYRRSVPLPAGTDADDVTASYSDGVLAIPGMELAAPRFITVLGFTSRTINLEDVHEQLAEDGWGQGYGTLRGKPFIRLSIHPSRDEEHAHGFVRAFEAATAKARRR